MRVTRVGYALGVAAAVAVFAGCSGSGSSLGSVASAPGGVGPQSVVRNHVPTILPKAVLEGRHFGPPTNMKSWASPDLIVTDIYTCSYYGNDCLWWKHGHNTVAGTIAGLSNPQGVAADPLTGNVYVANTGASNVPVYSKGSTNLVTTLSDSGQYPVDVAVGRGVVAVMNIFDTSFNPGSISIYVAGATSPTRILTDPALYQGISVSFDENNELLACFNNTSGTGECDVFAHARGHGVKVIGGDFSIGFAGGVAFDAVGNIAFNDQVAGTQYYTGAFSHCASDAYNGDELFLNFDRSTGDLYKANVFGPTGSNPEVEENAYSACSSGATNEKEYTAGLNASTNPPFGAAADPAPRV